MIMRFGSILMGIPWMTSFLGIFSFARTSTEKVLCSLSKRGMACVKVGIRLFSSFMSLQSLNAFLALFSSVGFQRLPGSALGRE